jgi:hypothetical protein
MRARVCVSKCDDAATAHVRVAEPRSQARLSIKQTHAHTRSLTHTYALAQMCTYTHTLCVCHAHVEAVSWACTGAVPPMLGIRGSGRTEPGKKKRSIAVQAEADTHPTPPRMRVCHAPQQPRGHHHRSRDRNDDGHDADGQNDRADQQDPAHLGPRRPLWPPRHTFIYTHNISACVWMGRAYPLPVCLSHTHTNTFSHSALGGPRSVCVCVPGTWTRQLAPQCRPWSALRCW